MRSVINVKTDCLQFNGFTPCEPHKTTGIHCDQCPEYRAVKTRILIIKTDAAGDVLRTTPILHALRKKHPEAEITWVTRYPELLSPNFIDKIIFYDWENALSLQAQKFDIVLSLDKSISETALASKIEATVKKGFLQDNNGRIIPADDDARHKWLTGISDEYMKKNKKHYVEEIFEVCGLTFSGEEYVMDSPTPWAATFNRSDFVVGLNTGAGPRWQTRVWPEQHFEKLIYEIFRQGWTPVLLGGKDEIDKNRRLAAKTGAFLPEPRPLDQFLSVVDSCHAVVTSVSLAMHIAIALKKRLVLINSIFPTNEFHLYGSGEIIEPKLSCQSCYKPEFDASCATPNCMDRITTAMVMDALRRQALLRQKTNQLQHG